MTDALKGVTKALSQMNRQINLPQINKILQDFEKESEVMSMKEEMMDDAVDGVLEEDGEEGESDEIVQKVLDEIGISLGGSMVDAPTTGFSAQEKQKDANDLEARLENLRKA